MSVYGVTNNLYLSTLAGSVIASIGFVALASALVSAEQSEKQAVAVANESLENGRSEQRFY